MQQSKASRVLSALRLKKRREGGWDHSLPIELLEFIFDYALEEFEGILKRSPITSRRRFIQPQLRAWACVCRQWYAMITPMLYREIYISSSNALASLARAVTKHPHLQPLVHSFQYFSITYKSARIEISEVDAWNLKRIYRACSNLDSLTVSRPRDFPPSDDELFRALNLDMTSVTRLTRLEIDLPQGVPCGSRILFSPELSLPALQELILNAPLVQGGIVPVNEREDHNYMEWPRMPNLTRLCIKNWYIRHACFCFPQYSDELRIIELLGGNYSSINSFFWRNLERYATTLESLTITAVDIAADQRHFVNLGYLTALTELCLPLPTFARWLGPELPENLQRLVLSGCPEKDFNENNNTMLRNVERNLGHIMSLRAGGRVLSDLRIVRVMVESIWLWRLGPAIDFKQAVTEAHRSRVRLIFGFLRGEENTFTDNLKEKLFEKFPVLERRLQ